MENPNFSFIHCADLHLDSPFEGIHVISENIAEVLRDATFRAFDNVITLAINERVDFLIIAGDVYDGADHSGGFIKLCAGPPKPGCNVF